MNTGFLGPAVATVLTACGIETIKSSFIVSTVFSSVATVLTACGIETLVQPTQSVHLQTLQQYLPLAVLKLTGISVRVTLPVTPVATVLTACGIETLDSGLIKPTSAVATVLTACGIETPSVRSITVLIGCNSTYRLRY